MKGSNGNGNGGGAYFVELCRGNRRRPAHSLSKTEADKFRTSLRHKIRFLEKRYQLGRSR